MTESGGELHLVFGASGYIGTHLVPKLLAAGKRVRASARNPEVLEGRGWHGVECVAADALDPASLDRVLTGVEVAYYLVHSMGSGRDFPRLDREGARNFRRAAERGHKLQRCEGIGRGRLVLNVVRNKRPEVVGRQHLRGAERLLREGRLS